MILIDTSITIILLILGIYFLDSVLGPILFFAAGAWAMFTVWIQRRK